MDGWMNTYVVEHKEDSENSDKMPQQQGLLPCAQCGANTALARAASVPLDSGTYMPVRSATPEDKHSHRVCLRAHHWLVGLHSR